MRRIQAPGVFPPSLIRLLPASRQGYWILGRARHSGSLFRWRRRIGGHALWFSSAMGPVAGWAAHMKKEAGDDYSTRTGKFH